MSEPSLHPDLEPLAFLLGTWRGEGAGEYPTIAPFRYVEEVEFTHVGRPYLRYEQRTRHPEKGVPMHGEAGYVRPAGPGAVELVIAQPTGIVETYAGTVRETRIDVATTAVARTPTAKEVTALERTIEVHGDVLRYSVRMAAVGQPLLHHLGAELRRARDA